MLKLTVATIAWAGAAYADTCGTPDTDSATCVCDGTTYDFSQIKPTDDNPYFSAPDQDSEYMYYFQMTNGGLPSDQGAMPYCTFSEGKEQGNAVGQGQIEGDACFPIGEVAQQSWEIDNSNGQAQTISITFAGGEEGRQTIIVATCDPTADNPTFQVKGEIRTLVYELDITTKYACGGSGPPSPPSPGPPSPGPPSPGPPSPGPSPAPGKQTSKPGKTGDILVILFFVGVIVYLVAGTAYQFKVKQATGSELIPNKEMWVSLWRLTKDGMTFTWAKIRRKEPTYATL